MNFATGDIVHFDSVAANDKQKFHLCLSFDGYFIFLNSPKLKSFLGDFVIDDAEITGRPKNHHGRSIASCSVVMQFTPAELAARKAKVTGKVSNKALRQLLVFVENLPTIPPDVRDVIIESVYDYLGF